jgi:hypothetical protein
LRPSKVFPEGAAGGRQVGRKWRFFHRNAMFGFLFFNAALFKNAGVGDFFWP